MFDRVKKVLGIGKKQSNKKVSNSGNGPSDFFHSMGMMGLGYASTPVQSMESQIHSVRFGLISKTWTTLSYYYTSCGIVQTIIDAPVIDAFAKGFDFTSADLTADQKEYVNKWMLNHDVIPVVKEAMRWMRLYGGSGIIIDDHMKHPEIPLPMERISSNSNIKLIPVSMWELHNNVTSHEEITPTDANYDTFFASNFNYKNITLHPSRVLRLVGKQAPDIIKRQLRGWGLSELEGLISALNRYMKALQASFEIIDECKLDVFKIQGLNSAMAGYDQEGLRKRVEQVNMFKNYNRAIILDSYDDYVQKTMSMDWIPNTMAEIRRQLSSEVSIPENRLFGLGSSGFSDGDDAQENYHTMIRGTIQEMIKPTLKRIIQVACANIFERVPRNIEVSFPSLRSMTEKEEEDTKMKRLERILAVARDGLISPLQAKSAINKEKILSIDLAENDEVWDKIATIGSQRREEFERENGNGKTWELESERPRRPDNGSCRGHSFGITEQSEG
jgi:phage-related protein (TIGR01555 family)